MKAGKQKPGIWLACSEEDALEFFTLRGSFLRDSNPVNRYRSVKPRFCGFSQKGISFRNPIRPRSQEITSISLGPLATGSEASHVSQCLEWLIKAFGPYGFSFSTKTRNGAAREKFPAIPTDKKW